MKIAIVNGSPRTENTAAMAEAFRQGAEAAVTLRVKVSVFRKTIWKKSCPLTLTAI